MTTQRPTVIGVDVGGTRIKLVRMRDGEVLDRHQVPSPGTLGSTFGATIADLVRSAAGDVPLEIMRVGVVVPGLVDDVTGMALWSANLGWRDLDVPGVVRAELGIPVAAGHDVRAGLLGESRHGAAAGARSALFLPLGTGVASALLVEGTVLPGSAWRGEIGHVVLDPDGPPCGCGRRGCLEALAGAGAIGRLWSQASGQTGDAEVVAALVSAGDPVASAVWTRAVDAITRAIAPIVTAVGVERVVVGGGLARSGDTLLQPLRASLARVLPPDFPVEVVAATLGEWAGAVGAACLAEEAT